MSATGITFCHAGFDKTAKIKNLQAGARHRREIIKCHTS